MVLGPGIMYSATTIITMAMALFFMFKLSPVLTLWVLIPVPFVVLAVRYFGDTIHRLSEIIQAALGVLSTRAQENLTGMRVIRAYTQEKAEIEQFDRANREYVDRNIKLIGTWSLFFPALSVLIMLSVVLLLGLGGKEVVNGRVTLGTLIAFYSFLIQLTFPMIAIGWVTNLVQRGAASVVRIHDLMTEKPLIDDAAALPELASSPIAGSVEFRNLSFTYATGPEVLHDLSLEIPAGSSLAITGPTGSGKSTLVSLIPRLQDAAPGMVLIDGRPIREYPLETLRRAIGFVPQETFLFSDTIRENIAFGVDEASDAQIVEAATTAHIATEIQEFPKGFQTIVGERGMTLSGGQKQRTAIARALLRDPRILILDDALASVDTHTEDQILSGLREAMQGRTTILIAHRISTARNADRIAVIVDGRIAELGTHDELLERGGYYAELAEKQSLEEEIVNA